MKIIKHLLSHVGLVIIISCVVAVIYFRSELFPNYINEPVDTALNEIGDKLGIEIPSYKPGVDSSDENENYQITANNEVDQIPVVVAEPEENVLEESSSDTGTGMVTTITESVTDTVNALFGDSEDKTGEGDNNLSDVVDEESQSVILVSKDDESGGVNAIIDNVSQTITDTVGASNDMELSYSRKTFIRARKAFWNGELQEAEKSYRELTEHEDLDPNAYGELGNVYYAQGKWQEAGKAYYEAAVRLIELKQPYQVNYLLRVIQGLDSESAEKLKQKMSG